MLLFSGELKAGEREHIFDIDVSKLDESNVLIFEHTGKVNEDTITNNDGEVTEDVALELVSLKIDGLNIPTPVLFETPFYPVWPDNILQKYRVLRQEPPLTIENSLYFGFNGQWHFEFSKEYLRDYYRTLWMDEDQAHRHQTKIKAIEGMTIETFERFGDDVSIDTDLNLTIHDLADKINNDPEFNYEVSRAAHQIKNSND